MTSLTRSLPTTKIHCGRKSFRHAAVFVSAAVLFGVGCVSRGRAQSQTSASVANPTAFEVATIKPHKAGYSPKYKSQTFNNNEFVATNIQIQHLIVLAYDLHDPSLEVKARLIPGGPRWLLSDWYDIEAKMSPSEYARVKKLTVDQQEKVKRQMLQSLLTDRFNLKVHSKMTDGPAYMLVIAKYGPKNMKKEPENAAPKVTWAARTHSEYHADPISDLVDVLERVERTPVIDKTGLVGKYSFVLNWSPDSAMVPPTGYPGAIPPEPAGPSLFSALQEELGLKLVPTKALVESIVIDHIDRPSER